MVVECIFHWHGEFGATSTCLDPSPIPPAFVLCQTQCAVSVTFIGF